jgi:GNAT superfamily N-acetyltransferase
MEWELREATVADAGTIAGLIRAAFAEYQGRLDPPSGAHRETAESVRETFLSGGAILAVAEGQPIGCVLYEVRLDHFYFGRLSVLPAFRGKGLGHALIAAAEARARQFGRLRLRLGVRLTLTEQRASYERLGFRPVEAKTHSGYAEPTYLIMEKELAP